MYSNLEDFTGFKPHEGEQMSEFSFWRNYLFKWAHIILYDYSIYDKHSKRSDIILIYNMYILYMHSLHAENSCSAGLLCLLN